MKKFLVCLLVVSLAANVYLALLLRRTRSRIVNPDRYILKTVIRELAVRYSPNTAFLRKLFPDEVIYLDENGVVTFEDYDSELERNSHDWSRLEKREDGSMVYNDPDVKSWQGIDVSKFSENVDWQKVKEQGIYFAMLRAGYRGYLEGRLNEDVYFRINAQKASEAGIKIGAYWFSQAITEEEAVEEAEYTVSLIKDYPISFPVVFDLEDAGGDQGRANNLTKEQETAIALAFCDRIRELGYTPMIYGGSNKLLGKLDLHQLKGIDIWYAQYASVPYYPYEFTMWQYTASGTLEGMKGDVDRNISFVDYSAK